MIKKVLLLASIPLMLASCGAEKVYTNVYYYFNLQEKIYFVKTTSGDEKTWKVKPENVYFIYVTNYEREDYRKVDTEFYVRGSSYKLYVYSY